MVIVDDLAWVLFSHFPAKGKPTTHLDAPDQ